MLERIEGYDWDEVFKYADGRDNRPRPVIGKTVSCDPFTREDVKRIIAIDDGENDGPDWVGVFELSDGRFAMVAAGCDYTGWG